MHNQEQLPLTSNSNNSNNSNKSQEYTPLCSIMGKYSDDNHWNDIVPLPQDDGGVNSLAAIAYTDDYSEAMSYLRAIMAKNEMSERALSLTEDIIDMNAAHYTVW
jgi:protein farnesyltransferase/geranylgeranyltransferase type-1 subunit alpha